ncbi:MAG TPA: threonine ammonia-lyase, biosynthetic [Verrucomicrobiae bacterium]|nr:threonine ammonia-lyase, biosynthetic [Verrucomicrobiae bacterium]
MSPVVVDDTVKAVLTSRVYEVAIESPLERATTLSSAVNCSVYLKREDLQSVHSFKLRGAYNKIAQLSPIERAKGVIAASAGNHAQGVALAAQKLGLSALIVMPRTTPSVKIEAVKGYGAEVELAGDSYSDAANYCKQRTLETGRTCIHPFDDPLVIAGQGTIGREILEQLPEVTHIFVPVGGGGLIAGIATYVKALRPDVQIISVEPADSNAMQLSIQQQKRTTLAHVGIFADGVAVKEVGEYTFEAVQRLVDDFITVTTDQICAAIKSVFEDTRSIVEPAGALAVAGIVHYRLPKDSRAVAVCSGANMTFERLQQVAERTLIGSGREAMFAVTLPEQTGALQKFCEEVIHERNISELSYRLCERHAAHVLVGVNVSGAADKRQYLTTMRRAGYGFIDLTDDDLAKEHVRHMTGGQAATRDEHIYDITFPERPGSLVDFLKAVGKRWNISLFHYRSAASDWGRVLIGFEAADKRMLERTLQNSGFEFLAVDTNDAIKLFIAKKD